MTRFMQFFVRVTGWPVQFLCFRTRVIYQDRAAQGRFIRGGAIIVSNHTAVYDYAVFLFVFFARVLRYQMAEVLFKKRPLGFFLKLMGGIRIDRDSTDLGFMGKSLEALKEGGVVGVFPEGRLPVKGETTPIAFRPGAAYLSMASGAKVIPVYTDGSYFRLKRAHVVIGVPMRPEDYTDTGKSEKENIAAFTEAMRNRIIELRGLADGRKHG